MYLIVFYVYMMCNRYVIFIGAKNISLGLYIKIIFACIYSSYVNQLEGSKYRIMVLFIFSRFFINMKTWIVLIWDHQFILIQDAY
jgi:hypothetical protein